MYNAGRQYGLGTDRQRSIRDRTKSIMERYAARIDSYFSKRGIDIYGDKPVSRRIYMGNNNGWLIMKSESQKANIQDESPNSITRVRNSSLRWRRMQKGIHGQRNRFCVRPGSPNVLWEEEWALWIMRSISARACDHHGCCTCQVPCCSFGRYQDKKYCSKEAERPGRKPDRRRRASGKWKRTGSKSSGHVRLAVSPWRRVEEGWTPSGRRRRYSKGYWPRNFYWLMD